MRKSVMTLLMALSLAAAAVADSVELESGDTLNGTIVETRDDFEVPEKEDIDPPTPEQITSAGKTQPCPKATSDNIYRTIYHTIVHRCSAFLSEYPAFHHKTLLDILKPAIVGLRHLFSPFIRKKAI